ncbi:MAG: hypothetical protein Q8O92_11000 [Candidatus Latescibacter sp.]|nr:hypothetical protein [Candidatus Latescibacter sp.]
MRITEAMKAFLHHLMNTQREKAGWKILSMAGKSKVSPRALHILEEDRMVSDRF